MPQAFHLTAKPAGALCNMRCAYCYFLGKRRLLGSDRQMDDAVLETFIRDYIACQEAEAVFFTWHGGEPTLLGVRFFEKVVALQKKHCPAGKRVANDLQTNGLLLDDAWCRFLKDHNFLVGLSLDGDGDRNGYRLDTEGGSTWSRAVKAAERLRAHGVDFNTLTVVSRRNVRRGRTLYRFLRDEVGSRHMQFMPLVELRGHETRAPFSREPADPPEVEAFSVKPEEWGRFLLEVFEEWHNRDIGSVFVTLFENFLSVWLGLGAKSCLFAPECSATMALDRDGGVYACDHFSYPEYKYGNIMEQPLRDILRSPARQDFAALKRRLPGQCRACRWLRACHGECPKKRFLKTESGEEGLNYLCAGYRLFFAGIDQRMTALAQAYRKLEGR